MFKTDKSKKTVIFLMYLLLLPGLASFIFIPSNMKELTLANQTIRLIAAELFTFIILLIIFKKDLKKDLKNFKKNFKKNIKESSKYYFIGLGLMVLFNFLINIVLFKGSLAANEEANRVILTKYPAYALIAMIFIAPIIEELAFRVNFKSLFKSDKLFIIFSTTLFASIHLAASFAGVEDVSSNLYQLLYILPYGALGWAFSKIYTVTNNMFYSMIFHIIQNAISIAIILTSL